jgi:PleD family two-component response regulator
MRRRRCACGGMRPSPLRRTAAFVDRQATIVVIEPERSVSALIELALGTPARTIVAKPQLSDAFDALSKKGGVDLLILDEDAPGYSIREARKSALLAAKRSNVPVIVLRAHEQTADGSSVPAERLARTLPKPFDIADLRALVEEALARRPTIAEGLDPVSGLQTKARFATELARLHAAARAQRSPLTLTIGEVHHRYGPRGRMDQHDVDLLVERVAAHIELQLRSTDSAGRLAELRFGMLHPSCDAAGARLIAERIAGAVAADSSLQGVRVCLGLAVDLDPENSAPDAVEAVAGEALRAAEADTENRFTLRFVQHP